MGIVKGVVKSNVTKNKIPKLIVTIGEVDVPVEYTSPYYDKYLGGFIALPAELQDVLLYRDVANNKYYYLSTVVSENSFAAKTNDLNDDLELIPDRVSQTTFDPTGNPRTISLSDAKGAIFKISDFYTPKKIVTGLFAKSQTGHSLKLIDSPETNCIDLKNSEGWGIRIMGPLNIQDLGAANSIQIETKGSQTFTNKNSDTLIWVHDGRDITIKNTSTGAFKNPGNPEQFGNVNILSEHKDINIFTGPNPPIGDGATPGNVFVYARGNNSIVQVKSNGEITLISNGNIKVRSSGNIEFLADGDLNFEGENVNIKSRSNFNVKSDGTIKLDGAGNTGIKGAQIHLNSPGTADVTAPNINIEERQNSLGIQ